MKKYFLFILFIAITCFVFTHSGVTGNLPGSTSCLKSNYSCWNSTGCNSTSNMYHGTLLQTTLRELTCMNGSSCFSTPMGVLCGVSQDPSTNITDFCIKDCNYQPGLSPEWLYPDCYDAKQNCVNVVDPKCNSRFVYNGNLSTTLDNEPCLSWDNVHILTTDGYTYSNIGEHNYCRKEIDGSFAPFCFNAWLDSKPCFNTCPNTTTNGETSKGPTTTIQTNSDITTTSTSFVNDISTFIPGAVTNTTMPCEMTNWEKDISCTNCGDKAVLLSYRWVLNKDNTPTNCVNLTMTEPCPNPTPCHPMTPVLRAVSKALVTLESSWVIGTICASLIIHLLLRTSSYERFLHQQEELTLLISHVFLYTAAFRYDEPILCIITSSALQLFFMSSFFFFLFESLHTYCVYTQVLTTGSFLSKFKTALTCYGISFLITFVTTITNLKNLRSDFVCWVNIGHRVAYGTFVPICSMIVITVIVIESMFMGHYPILHITNKSQMFSASFSRIGLLNLYPLQIASWFTMAFATHFQYFPLFPACFYINIIFGWKILMYHFGNDEVKQIIRRVFRKVKQKFKK